MLQLVATVAAQPAYVVFHSLQLKNGNFRNLFFLIFWPFTMIKYHM